MVVCLVLLVPAISDAATDPKAPDAARTMTQSMLLLGVGILVVLSLLLAWRVPGFRRLVIGEDNRVSTSKTITSVWTYLVAGMLLGIVFARWAGHPQAFNAIKSGLGGQYALLIGGPIGAAILAKGIVVSQTQKPNAHKPPSPTGPSLNDLIANDAGRTDPGDLQYVLFNLVAMIYVVGAIVQHPLAGFPHIPEVLLSLTSVSAVGYVGKKGIPSVTPSATIDPPQGPVGSQVTIRGTALLAGELPTALTRVEFGTTEAAITQRVENQTDTLLVTVPPGLAGGTPLEVVVITPSLIHVKAGSFTPS